MRTIIYITLFLSGHFCTAQNAKQKKYYLSDNKTISTAGIKTSYVFESPDKKYISFTDESLEQVYIKKITAKDIPKLVFSSQGCGYFPTWTSNSNSILMKSKTKSDKEIKNETVEYILKTNKTLTRPDIDFRSVQSFGNLNADTDPIIYINQKLQLIKTDAKSKAIIVLEDKQSCYQPILSPDKQKVAVHIGNEIWVYDIIKKEKPLKIGNGLVTSWSSDSKFLVGFTDVSKDGHELSNSELYLYEIANQATYQLTKTEDIIEINPSFSQDGKKIYYINSKDGSIIISQLKTN